MPPEGGEVGDPRPEDGKPGVEAMNARKEMLTRCIKARLFIRNGMHVADARLVLRRAQQQLVRQRAVR